MLLATAACAAATPAPAPAAQPEPTVVIVVRHAERAAEPASDPALSAEGRARAQALPDAVGAAPVAAIYTTQFRRTRETAEPLAVRAGVPVTPRPASGENLATHADDLARHILATHAGQTVVVVGHSNTVPALVAALSGAPAPPLTEADYGDLFRIVIPPSGAARVERSRFGP